MPAFLLALLKYVPLLGGLLEKWTENKSRAAELRAEKELVEAKAFAKGRIGPKYLTQYVLVGVLVVFAAATFVAIFIPSALPYADLTRFRDLINAGEGMAGKM